MKILAFDPGYKYVGVAIGDTSFGTIVPLKPVVREGNALALGQFKRLIKLHQPEKMIFGMPYNMDGTRGVAAKKTKNFVNKIRKHFPGVDIDTVDERLSSWSVKNHFGLNQTAKETGGSSISSDSLAAVEILNLYLSSYEQRILKGCGLWNSDLIVLNEVSSTNTWIKEHPSLVHDGTVVSALRQTAGRGRQGRFWRHFPGKSAAFSVKVAPPDDPLLWPNTAQVAAAGICETLELYGVAAGIKWPNDILVDDRKICGVLTETVTVNGKTKVIIGIGLNVHVTEEDLKKEVDVPAASIFTVTQKEISCDKWLTDFLNIFEKNLEVFYKKGFEPFYDYYSEKILKDRSAFRINRDLKEPIEIISLTKTGRLMVRQNGKSVELEWGEISFL